MLRIPINLDPQGRRWMSSKIGCIYIWNTGEASFNTKYDNYEFIIYQEESQYGDQILECGVCVHQRNLSVICLLAEVINRWQSKMTIPIEKGSYRFQEVWENERLKDHGATGIPRGFFEDLQEQFNKHTSISGVGPSTPPDKLVEWKDEDER